VGATHTLRPGLGAASFACALDAARRYRQREWRENQPHARRHRLHHRRLGPLRRRGCDDRDMRVGQPRSRRAATFATLTFAVVLCACGGTTAVNAARLSTTNAVPTQRSGMVCSLRQLTVSVMDGLAGAGHSSSVILVRNRGPSMCHLEGYPEIRFFNGGRTEAAVAIETPTGFTGGLPTGAPLSSVELHSGEVASAVMEGTDIPTGGATACPSFHDYTITLPGIAGVVHINRETGSCSGLYVHPMVIGFNGTNPSGEVAGSVPACNGSANLRPATGSFVQVQALSGSTIAGMVTVAASSRVPREFQIILKPGNYSIRSALGRSTPHVTVRAGRSTLLGILGNCSQVISVPTTTPGLGTPMRSTTTTS